MRLRTRSLDLARALVTLIKWFKRLNEILQGSVSSSLMFSVYPHYLGNLRDGIEERPHLRVLNSIDKSMIPQFISTAWNLLLNSRLPYPLPP